jgi:hypothetical protein
VYGFTRLGPIAKPALLVIQRRSVADVFRVLVVVVELLVDFQRPKPAFSNALFL